MTEKDVTVVIDTSDPPAYFEVRGNRYVLRHPPETLLIDKEYISELQASMSVEIDRDRAKHCLIARIFVFPRSIVDKRTTSELEAIGWNVNEKLVRAKKKYDEYQSKED